MRRPAQGEISLLFRPLFGEIAFMLWLVIKGATLPALDATASSSATA